MASFSWFRSWHGAPTDPKWLVIAAKAGVKPGVVIAVAWALMDHASQHRYRGTVSDFDAELFAVFSGFGEPEINAVIQAMNDKKFIVDGKLANWSKRQPKRNDNSSERVKKYRDNRERVGLPRASNYNSDFIFERDGHKCVYCGSDENLVVDHVYPLSKGGTDDPDNLVCACKKCNAGKAGRTIEDSGLKFLDSHAMSRYTEYLSRTCHAPVTHCHGPEKRRGEEIRGDKNKVDDLDNRDDVEVDVVGDNGDFQQLLTTFEDSTGIKRSMLDEDAVSEIYLWVNAEVTQTEVTQAVREIQAKGMIIAGPQSLTGAINVVRSKNKSRPYSRDGPNDRQRYADWDSLRQDHGE